MKTKALVEQIISIIVLLILLFYTVSDLFVGPYIGFHFEFINGRITHLFTIVDGSDPLLIGDIVENIDNVSLVSFQSNITQSFFADAAPGDIVEILVTRDGRSEMVNWILPEFNSVEFAERLSNIWWLAYIFWFAGLLTVLLIRPIDLRQQLLVTFFFLTALWIGLGAFGRDHLWYSTLISRTLILLSVPVYLHFHWIYPRPLKNTRTIYWIPLYVIGITLALAQLFQLLPPSIFVLGAIIAMAGSLFLLFIRLLIRRDERRDIVILFILALFAFLPTIAISSTRLSGSAPLALLFGLFALGGLPGAYFYIAYRKQPGWVEFRANRLIGLYLFLIFLFVITIIASLLVSGQDLENITLLEYLLLMTGIVLITVLGFPPFQNWVDKNLLNIPMDREHLVESYAARITANLNRQILVKLLREELMPTLQVRQSAIVKLDSKKNLDIFYEDGVTVDQILIQDKLEKIAEDADLWHPPSPEGSSWVRLAIPLQLDGQLEGVWLFGRHDPDDVYSQEDVQLLQLLGNQTAVALANINQTELLQNLYTSNIQRQEEERTSLARHLHDDVLNDLAVLSLQRQSEGAGFSATYEELTNQIRLMIRDLRPAMLDYGLWRTFDEMLDDLQDRPSADVLLKFDIPKSDVRYPPEIEQHLFRIVQQAVENALQHAQASTIRLHGDLREDEVSLIVEDNGRGLPEDLLLDLSTLLNEKHFGLVGLFERAELIGAQLEITAEAGKFTRMNLIWRKSSYEPDQRTIF
jgi:signal transduction histidine kinase